MIAVIQDVLAGLFILGGGAFCVIAAAGVIRMPDVFVRMHASTKAGTLGVGLISLGTAIAVASTDFTVKATLIVTFMILTAPVGAHLLGRAAFRSKTPVWKGTEFDKDVHFFDANQSTHSTTKDPSEG